MQALADLLTVQQEVGTEKKIKICFIGDANNVAFSLFEIFLMMGHECSFAGPKEYSFSSEDEQYLKNVAEKFSGSPDKMSFSHDAKEAIQDTDFVYADTFISMGEEDIYDEKIQKFSEFQINAELLKFSGKNTEKKIQFMHCLPAHRGEEVSAEVIDNPEISLIYSQAKNRMVVSKGVFSWLCV
jgi:ornithine carbamoyltransferase